MRVLLIIALLFTARSIFAGDKVQTAPVRTGTHTTKTKTAPMTPQPNTTKTVTKQ